MTSDSYVSVYLMEYAWKTEQMSGGGKTNYSSAGDESLEEGTEEEQGENSGISIISALDFFLNSQFYEPKVVPLYLLWSDFYPQFLELTTF